MSLACRIRSALVLALPLLLPAAPAHSADEAGACRYVPVASLPLQFSDQWLKLTVEGSINGKPATMAVSTGSQTSNLTRTATERLGIPMRESGHYGLGIGGASVIYTARVDDFAVGAAHGGKMVLPVWGNTGMAPLFDAMVGADFLLQTDMEIALAERQLRFFRAHGCGDTFLAYWDPKAMEIPFGGTQGPSKNPRFMVELNGVRMEAEITTGSQQTAVSRKAAERAGIRLDRPDVAKAGVAVGVGEAKVRLWSTVFDSFSIGNETIKNPRLRVLDTPPQGDRGGADVMLGADFLRAHRVLFAMSQRRLYISYTGGEVFGR